MIAAAAAITGEAEIVVIGSQAVLGAGREIPPSMLRSMEADIYPLHAPEKAIEIDGALGDGSPFHRAFGYYAHGVGPETAKAPRGWQDRLVPVEVPRRPAGSASARAHCLEIHDLVLAKCVAGRERDWGFAGAAIEAGLAELGELEKRVALLPATEAQRDQIRSFLGGQRDRKRTPCAGPS